MTIDKSDIRALTGLRGSAASLVAVYHYCFPLLRAGMFRQAIGRGYLWVDLFFMLSGFILALNYEFLFESGFSWAGFGAFLIRRVARIYPLYIVLVVIRLGYTAVAFGTFHSKGGDGAAVVLGRPALDIFANLLLIQAWGVGASIVGTAWSLSAEWAAYRVLPLLPALTVFGGRCRAAAAAAVAGGLLLVVAFIDRHYGGIHSGALDAWNCKEIAPLLRCLASFSFGLLTYRLARSRRVCDCAAHDTVGFAILAALTAMFAAGAADLAIVLVFPALILSLTANRGRFARLFANGPMVRLGLLSYAIYLLHPCLQPALPGAEQLLGRVLPRAVAVALAEALLLMMLLPGSAAAYSWIEVPARKWLRDRLAVRLPQLSGRPRPRAAAAR